jgi:hypothetical protein
MQAQNQQSETERNKEVVRRFVEEVQNNRDWAVYDELNAPDFVNLSAPPGVPSAARAGRYSSVRSWTRFQTAGGP